MIWQDLIFTVGSVFSIIVLAPSLTDETATIPLGTSVPSAFIGLVYGSAFFTMGMTFSAAGSLATGVLWSLIAALRSPDSPLDAVRGRVASADAARNGHTPSGD